MDIRQESACIHQTWPRLTVKDTQADLSPNYQDMYKLLKLYICCRLSILPHISSENASFKAVAAMRAPPIN